MSTSDVASREMPRYKCHKEVWALKILGIEREENGSLTITPVDSGYVPFNVPAEFVPRHREGAPQIGWYYVVYKDGYQSFSPAEAFEEGYTLAT